MDVAAEKLSWARTHGSTRWGVHHTGTFKVYAPRACLNLHEKVTQHSLWGRNRQGKLVSGCRVPSASSAPDMRPYWRYSNIKTVEKCASPPWKTYEKLYKQCVWPWAPRRKFNMQSPALITSKSVHWDVRGSSAICESPSGIRLKPDFKNFLNSAGQRVKAKYKVRSHGEKL